MLFEILLGTKEEMKGNSQSSSSHSTFLEDWLAKDTDIKQPSLRSANRQRHLNSGIRQKSTTVCFTALQYAQEDDVSVHTASLSAGLLDLMRRRMPSLMCTLWHLKEISELFGVT
jgi:hypothetical protein